MKRVFIGYDQNETVAYHVLAHSILEHSSVPVSITPLKLDQLPLTRERAPLQSTEFSFSRFLVPWLCDYQGQALFIDCDMLFRGDISDLFACFDNRYAVQVVQHEYEAKPEQKFLNQPQSLYAKKNWSSVMLFNNDRCRRLTPQVVNSSTGLSLHQFKWIDDEEIGSLPKCWNHLVGESGQEELSSSRLIHYTQGTPCFTKYANGDAASLWHAAKSSMLHHNTIGEFSKERRTGT